MSAKTLISAADELPIRMALRRASADTPKAEQKAAAIKRAEYIVEVLSNCVVDPAGYRFDRERGARFLENMRKQNWSRADKTQQEIHDWLRDHGQSLDWVYDGDPVGMICKVAANAARRPRLVSRKRARR